jgi:phosphatidylserine/phosphatidylglycerophosphate/cardiolipin synthase-like enzyme
MLLLIVSFFCAQASASGLAERLGSPENSASLDALTRTSETLNRVTLLHLGVRSKPARLKLLEEARNYVFATVPYWFDDQEGNVFYEAAKRKLERTPGFDFRVMVDWTSPGSSKDLLGVNMYARVKELTGGKTLQWNKIWTMRSWSLDFTNRRLHDKILVADGRRMIMGGMNIADDYLQGGRTAKGWHDTDVLIEGPAAQQGAKFFLKPYLLQRYLHNPFNPFPRNTNFQIKVLHELFYGDKGDGWFRSNWPWKFRSHINVPIERYLSDPTYFPALPEDPEARTPVRLIYDNPLVDRTPGTGDHYSKLMNTLEFVVPQARTSMKLFVPYLTTTDRMNDLLIAAAKRLKVQIITNSLKSHDLGDLNYKAALVNFAKLMSHGVEIHEWQGHEDLKAFERAHACAISGYWPGNTLHTKAVILDGEVAIIGSHNFNFRSERLNSELMALIRDPAFARELEAVFEYDLDRVGDAPGGTRLLGCGGLTYANRPRRTVQVSQEALDRHFRKWSHRAWIWFLHLFQPVM